MIVDSHLHLMQKKNFDLGLWKGIDVGIPEDTDINNLVTWLKQAGVERAVVMGQDMSRIWNTNMGEDYVVECVRKYPNFLIGLCSIEPLDKFNKFNQPGFDHFKKSITENGMKGVLLTPPYGQYNSNDRNCYPFYEEAVQHNVVVQYHHSAQIGPAILCPTKNANLFNLNDVILDFPDLKIIIEHIGYPWSNHLFVLMSGDENLWADIAMMTVRPYYTTWHLVMAKEFGVLDRIMYASDFVAPSFSGYSDFPQNDFQSYIEYVQEDLNKICKKCGWPIFKDQEIEGILGENAKRLYSSAIK